MPYTATDTNRIHHADTTITTITLERLVPNSRTITDRWVTIIEYADGTILVSHKGGTVDSQEFAHNFPYLWAACCEAVAEIC